MSDLADWGCRLAGFRVCGVSAPNSRVIWRHTTSYLATELFNRPGLNLSNLQLPPKRCMANSMHGTIDRFGDRSLGFEGCLS